MNDNRNYDWNDSSVFCRSEYQYIEAWVERKSTLIDLGCGNGSLLRILRENKDCQGHGIEINKNGVIICQQNGLNVREGRIDIPLNHIDDNKYEYAICNVSIQMVSQPEILLSEMKRIAKYQIVSFPNFAFIWQRLELLFSGRMPRKLLYGYNWYNTGHIHQFSINDFKITANDMGLRIIDSVFLLGKHRTMSFLANIFATEAIFLLQGEDTH